MKKGSLRRPSPALVVALVALFVALGGTSYAAITLPRNSVGTAQIKNRAVTQTKIAKKTLAYLHGRRGAAGHQGPAGPPGSAGAQGIPGLPGPVNLTYVTVEGTAFSGMSGTADATCPAGMVVTGGGVLPATPEGNQVSVGESDWVTSTTNGPPDTWEGVLSNSSGTDVNFFVDAVCAKPTTISSAASKSAKALR